MRLHVYMRDLGMGSRRKAEQLIAEGRVTVDGIVGKIGQQVTGTEQIQIENTPVVSRPINPDKIYILINKPVGVTSTTEDEHAEETVLELLPRDITSKYQLQIAGRLDKDSDGLMLLTNDGHAVYVLTHPKFEVEKEYLIKVDRKLMSDEEQELLHGIRSMKGTVYTFKKCTFVEMEGNYALYKVILLEGKKREIREALKIFGVRVLVLTRIRLGVLGLPAKSYEILTNQKTNELHMFIARTEKQSPSVKMPTTAA